MTLRRTALCAARRVFLVGPVPPPLHGVTAMTAALLHTIFEAGGVPPAMVQCARGGGGAVAGRISRVALSHARSER